MPLSLYDPCTSRRLVRANSRANGFLSIIREIWLIVCTQK